MSIRAMPGVEDLTGQSRGSLLIEGIAQRQPLRWRVRCTNPGCNCSAVIDHMRLQNGAVFKCPNRQCGKAPAASRSRQAQPGASEAIRSRDSESAREFRNREAELEAQQQQAAEELQTAERARLDEEQRQAVRERQRKYFSEALLSGPDAFFHIDPATYTPLPKGTDLTAWHREEARKFAKANPSYYPCPENFGTIKKYIDVNAPNIRVVSALQMTWAYQRLAEYGLLKGRPAPMPEPTPEAAKRPAFVNRGIKPETTPPDSPDALVSGWDLDSGAPRMWTNRELDRLNALDYRKALRLYTPDAVRTLETTVVNGQGRRVRVK